MNIVLVHGAWADGSSWSKTIPLLQAKGYNVLAPQFPHTSLADNVAKLQQAAIAAVAAQSFAHGRCCFRCS